ncbi:murein DD-endopeptidase MepM/ murein hydrolase activator NlpD [Microbacterium sp. SLBN-146]|nr:murein DD-endopeptidase MepM/ murein hydrolase activator NlpD [Microbacterium sp. SLBN-146]
MHPEQVDEECGCAPSARERRRLWPSSVSRRTALGLGVLGLAAAGGLAGPLVAPAFAATYPSWPDVEKAKANEAAKAAEVKRIEGLIQALTDDVALKQQLAEQAADELFIAQQEYNEAAYRTQQLQAEADAQAATAAGAAEKAGRVAAQLYRNGGDDTSLELFFAGSAASADDLLARLGTLDKLFERNSDVYAQAVTARDAAQTTTDLAEVQRQERDRLQKVAEEKMAAAQAAADAAAAALAAQEQYLGTLEAQLAALKDTTAKTVADYQEGERIRIENERRAREEAERKAREEAAAIGNSGGGGGGGSSGGGGGSGGGAVVGSGWARPSSGRFTSGYGPRSTQCGPQGCASSWHLGTDMAAGCGAGIYAAAAGTVSMAQVYSGYGNYVRIEHGGGIATGYAHASQLLVSRGQWVNAGQLIAREGQTGRSFGCHLHFEVYTPSGTTNPQNFMAARGVWL